MCRENNQPQSMHQWKVITWNIWTWCSTFALHLARSEEGFEDPRWTSYWPRRPQSTSLYYGNTTGFWLSPLSRGRWYNCTSYRSMQCLNASSERNTWWFYSSIGYAEWYPLASPPEVCQSFKEVLSTLRSVGDAHWAHAVASALGVCLAGIRPEGKVRMFNITNDHIWLL